MKTLKAIYDEELEEFLEKIGLLEDIRSGMVKCEGCGEIITLDNFGAVSRRNGKLVVFCNSPKCVSKSIRTSSE
ncbi:hypothetical protein J7K18_01745 [bacterium]|nr:hypothetical protein [bacterium]